MEVTVEFNTDSQYHSVSFENNKGTIFSVCGILYDKTKQIIIIDHGLSLEE